MSVDLGKALDLTEIRMEQDKSGNKYVITIIVDKYTIYTDEDI